MNENQHILKQLEQFVPPERLEAYRDFVAYQLKHHPSDEIGRICEAAGWFGVVAGEVPARLNVELSKAAILVDELRKTTDKAQEVNATSLAAAEKIENARALLQNSEAMGTAIAEAKKALGVLHWKFVGWFAVAAVLIALALGYALGQMWNHSYERKVLATLSATDGLNRVLVQEGRSAQFIKDASGINYFIISGADEAFAEKGQGIIKFK